MWATGLHKGRPMLSMQCSAPGAGVSSKNRLSYRGVTKRGVASHGPSAVDDSPTQTTWRKVGAHCCLELMSGYSEA